MKKVLTKGFLFLLFSTSIVLYCCSKQDLPTKSPDSPDNTAKASDAMTGKLSATTSSSNLDTCGSCSNYYTGNWGGTGPHIYPDQPLDLSCADSGSTVSLSCIPNDVPNQFEVRDSYNALVTTTGWVGWAHCSGQWGPGPVATASTVAMSFTYNPARKPYRLTIRTDVRNGQGCGSGGCTDQGCLLGTDNWTVSVNCAGRNVTCVGQNCPPPRPDTSCKSCNKSFTGTWATSGGVHYHNYPDITLDLSCALNNSTVQVGCVYYDVPNTFAILDKNGNTVANTHWGTTDWIGWANCTGPWGNSIKTNQSETYIAFVYNSANAPYVLRVQTDVLACTGCDPTHTVGCEAGNDTWLANIFCKTH